MLTIQAPVVVLGAMWPEYAARLRATETDPAGGQRPRFPGAADILAGGWIHEETLSSFSGAEREAAAKLSGDDPRLAEALVDPHFNVTEVLAGAPELDRRYKQASEEQRAMMDAAVDARRLGIQGPLPTGLLRDAARGYFETVHADDAWFAPAIAELTRQDRATAPLIPVSHGDRRSLDGYTVADYLLQRLSRERRYKRLRAVT
jgi:hypothetical protein